MSEHDEPDAPEDEDATEDAAEEEKQNTSTTPNLRIPKADRWKVQDKVVDEAETK